MRWLLSLPQPNGKESKASPLRNRRADRQGWGSGMSQGELGACSWVCHRAGPRAGPPVPGCRCPTPASSPGGGCGGWS